MTELECQSNQTPVIKSQKTELNQTIEELENTLRDKEEVCVLCDRVEYLAWNLMAHATPATWPFNLLSCPLGNGKVERGIGKYEWPDGAKRHPNPETWGGWWEILKKNLASHLWHYLPYNDIGLPYPGDRTSQSSAGGATGGSRAAAGGEPGGTGEFQEESADAAGAAGWQDLWADGAQRHLGSAHRGGQLEMELLILHWQSHMIA